MGDLGSLIVLAAVVVFFYLVIFGRSKKAAPAVPPPPDPADQKRRDEAIEKLEQHAASVRQKMQTMEDDLENDPAAAARTLRRIMKKR